MTWLDQQLALETAILTGVESGNGDAGGESWFADRHNHLDTYAAYSTCVA